MTDQNKNANQQNSKYDDVIGGFIIALYITGLFMFCRYIVKSVGDTVQRNREKQKQESPIAPNKQLNNVFNYSNLKQR